MVPEFPIVNALSVAQALPAAAFDGTRQRYLVVWQDNRSTVFEIFGQWVTPPVPWRDRIF